MSYQEESLWVVEFMLPYEESKWIIYDSPFDGTFHRSEKKAKGVEEKIKKVFPKCLTRVSLFVRADSLKDINHISLN